MNFKEVKEKIRTFVNDELITLEPWIVNSDWSEKLPKLNELREKVKKMGFWLPQVSKEYGGLGLSLEQHGEVAKFLVQVLMVFMFLIVKLQMQVIWKC